MSNVSVNIKVNPNLIGDFDDACARALERCGIEAEKYAKELCPVKSGDLRGSITHTQTDKTTEVIGTPVEYAP